MPLYDYQCSGCKTIFELTVPISQFKGRPLSECCNAISVRRGFLPGSSPSIKMGGFKGVDKAQIKKAEKHGDIDGGIPFGQVPGDSIYKKKDFAGRSIGENGYAGPVP